MDALDEHKGEVVGDGYASPDHRTWQDMALPPFLLANALRHLSARPSPIQRLAVNAILATDRDVIVSSPTGSGKTAAYVLPLLGLLSAAPRGAAPSGGPSSASGRGPAPRVVILAPTHILVRQICGEVAKLAADAPSPIELYGIYGRNPPEPPAAVDIVVASPSRAVSTFQGGQWDLAQVQCLVLDEGDCMLTGGFAKNVRAIMDACSHPKRRLLFLSATVSAPVVDVMLSFTRRELFVKVGKISTLPPMLYQEVLKVEEADKMQHLNRVVLSSRLRNWNVLVFVKDHTTAAKVSQQLRADCPRERCTVASSASTFEQTETALEKFGKRTIPILVATDIVSRGIDFPAVEVVVNYDAPDTVDDYIHRVGCAARAGRPGMAVSYFNDKALALRPFLGGLLRTNEQAVPDFLQTPVGAAASDIYNAPRDLAVSDFLAPTSPLQPLSPVDAGVTQAAVRENKPQETDSTVATQAVSAGPIPSPPLAASHLADEAAKAAEKAASPSAAPESDPIDADKDDDDDDDDADDDDDDDDEGGSESEGSSCMVIDSEPDEDDTVVVLTGPGREGKGSSPETAAPPPPPTSAPALVPELAAPKSPIAAEATVSPPTPSPSPPGPTPPPGEPSEEEQRRLQRRARFEEQRQKLVEQQREDRLKMKLELQKPLAKFLAKRPPSQLPENEEQRRRRRKERFEKPAPEPPQAIRPLSPSASPPPTPTVSTPAPSGPKPPVGNTSPKPPAQDPAPPGKEQLEKQATEREPSSSSSGRLSPDVLTPTPAAGPPVEPGPPVPSPSPSPAPAPVPTGATAPKGVKVKVEAPDEPAEDQPPPAAPAAKPPAPSAPSAPQSSRPPVLPPTVCKPPSPAPTTASTPSIPAQPEPPRPPVHPPPPAAPHSPAAEPRPTVVPAPPRPSSPPVQAPKMPDVSKEMQETASSSSKAPPPQPARVAYEIPPLSSMVPAHESVPQLHARMLALVKCRAADAPPDAPLSPETLPPAFRELVDTLLQKSAAPVESRLERLRVVDLPLLDDLQARATAELQAKQAASQSSHSEPASSTDRYHTRFWHVMQGLLLDLLRASGLLDLEVKELDDGSLARATRRLHDRLHAIEQESGQLDGLLQRCQEASQSIGLAECANGTQAMDVAAAPEEWQSHILPGTDRQVWLNQEGGAAVWTRPVKAEAVVLGHLVDHAAGAYQTWLTRCLQDAAQVLATDEALAAARHALRCAPLLDPAQPAPPADALGLGRALRHAHEAMCAEIAFRRRQGKHGRFPLGTLLLALQWGREALGAERQFLLAAAQRVEDWRREMVAVQGVMESAAVQQSRRSDLQTATSELQAAQERLEDETVRLRLAEQKGAADDALRAAVDAAKAAVQKCKVRLLQATQALIGADDS
eukprot:EG_transcript_492